MKDENGVYHNKISKSILIRRLLWNICSKIFFRPFPTKFFCGWNRTVLRIFGARLEKKSVVHSNCTILCPWNLNLGENACIGPHCVIENDTMISLGANSTVSQYSYLCTSSHDIYHKEHELIYAPITIRKDAWVGAGAFVGKGITIGEGAVVAARSVVVKDVQPWDVVGGNPAKYINRRIFKD